MSLILSFETSTKVCSVALHKDGSLLACSEVLVEKSHSKIITLLAENLLRNLSLKFQNLDAIAVSKGPGSYTGLRIGVSTAKGYCFGLDKPLIGVNTLKAMAASVNIFIDESTLLCPMLDARRMEVYCALFDNKLNFIEETNAKIIDKDSFSDKLKNYKIIFFGDGAFKCREVILSDNARFIEGIYPSARQIGEIASLSFAKNEFENTVYFEPFYLKDFVSTSH
jgi:tRNA threonylcarbamoyladenosine biosynthesis protein TsaB